MFSVSKMSFSTSPLAATFVSAMNLKVPYFSTISCLYAYNVSAGSLPLASKSWSHSPSSVSRPWSLSIGYFHETVAKTFPEIFMFGSFLSPPTSFSGSGREDPLSASSEKSADFKGSTMSLARGPKEESGGNQASPKKSLPIMSISQTSKSKDCWIFSAFSNPSKSFSECGSMICTSIEMVCLAFGAWSWLPKRRMDSASSGASTTQATNSSLVT
mmetsp:Transcript_56901/g.92151  ORF Transcript_56901/g.92151 Transcript_56901/m.92151 type:complete len:215 (-) Transcript_56901:1389-2033(-)